MSDTEVLRKVYQSTKIRRRGDDGYRGVIQPTPRPTYTTIFLTCNHGDSSMTDLKQFFRHLNTNKGSVLRGGPLEVEFTSHDARDCQKVMVQQDHVNVLEGYITHSTVDAHNPTDTLMPTWVIMLSC